MIKRILGAAITLTATAGLLAAPTAASASSEATRLGTCTYSARKPVLAGGTIFAYAPWRCGMAPDEVTVMYVEIFRDGRSVKFATFSRYGVFSQTNATGVPCIAGVHTYKVRTFGWSGDQPTSWLPKDSPTYTNTSGRCS
ncbi:hypothetical protein Plo01_60880 [Planobispora longispora]|uniref:Secreted protein n=1 Tax=Planobispora longispora TaxID=28887 RepID=A0A8J3RU82_9ACTN|nr:hypothetical protein GCM10020093_109460 [Planobispora longispora]GIH79659.1 hypothetical protein Plo01_60880 [Planobispora longispora]